jgi:hypothetical protein
MVREGGVASALYLRLTLAALAALLLVPQARAEEGKAAMHARVVEAKASMTVSVTVIRPCTISSSPGSGTLSDGEILTVDCGETKGVKVAESQPRIRVCDARLSELWCVRLRQRHSNHEIRVVRFD